MHNATVVFDLDGTLVDTSPDLIAALQAVLAGLGLPEADEAAFWPLAGRGARVMIETAIRSHGAALPDREEMNGLVSEFVAHYRARITHASRPFPGCEAALTALAVRGATLAVCTGKREDLAVQLLTGLKLAQRFKAIVGGDSLPVCKPHPGHVLGAIAAAGGSPLRAVMIGDSAADVDAAKAAGVPVIAVSFGYSDTPVAGLGADLVIAHFDELYGAVETLLSAG